MVFSLSVFWWRRIRGLWKLPDGRDWLRGKLGLVLMGGSMLSRSLIWLPVDGWGCVPSLLFTWGQTGGGDEDNGDLLQKIPCTTATLGAPNPAAGHHRPMPPLETWMLWGKPGSVSCGVTAPFSWVLVCSRFVWALWASLVGMGFDSKPEFAPPTVLLGLPLCPWTWGISSPPPQCRATVRL